MAFTHRIATNNRHENVKCSDAKMFGSKLFTQISPAKFYDGNISSNKDCGVIKNSKKKKRR